MPKFHFRFNPKKCVFLVYSRVVLGYIISNEGNLINLKNISVIMDMLPLKISRDIQMFNGMA